MKMQRTPITKLEDARCPNCIFCITYAEDGHLDYYCSRTHPLAEEPAPVPEVIDTHYCGEGGWFVSTMDLIHSLLQVYQYFNIKGTQETEE